MVNETLSKNRMEKFKSFKTDRQEIGDMRMKLKYLNFDAITAVRPQKISYFTLLIL